MVIHLLNYRHCTCTHCGAPSVLCAGNEPCTGQERPSQAAARPAKWSQVGSKISCSREERSRLAETRLLWLILPRGTGWAEHAPPFLQFSRQWPSGPAEDGVPRAGRGEPPRLCRGQDLSPGGQGHRETRGSLFPWHTNTGWRVFYK